MVFEAGLTKTGYFSRSIPPNYVRQGGALLYYDDICLVLLSFLPFFPRGEALDFLMPQIHQATHLVYYLGVEQINGILREKCVLCGTSSFHPALRIPNFPVFMGTSASESSETDKIMDQVWVSCEKCGTLQLSELVPLDILYQQNHNDAIGPTWELHASELVDFLLQSENPRSILEIGAGDGKIAQKILEKRPDLSYSIIEPNFTGKQEGIQLYQGYVENHLNLIEECDLILHSHVLEHLYSPFETLRLISERMPFGSKMALSFPNLDVILRSGGANALNFEHTYFVSEQTLGRVFQTVGLNVARLHRYRGHSLFFLLEKVNKVTGRIELGVTENAVNGFKQFWSRIDQLAGNLAQVIREKPNSNAYCFGAHVFSQAILARGVELGSIRGILDNSPRKIGQRLYGTTLRVFDPAVLARQENPIVALAASHFQDEIRSQLLGINHQTIILEPR